MTGEAVLGGAAAFVAFWIFMSALEGLGYAFPVRPSVIVPENWATGAQALIFVIFSGVLLSLAVPYALGDPVRFGVFHLILLLALLLPIWEILAARMYGDSFVIVNGRQDEVKPILVAAVGRVFGQMYLEKDMLYSVDHRGEDWQIIPHEHEHLLVLDPTYKVPMRRRRIFEKTLDAALKGIEPAGFNRRSFLISFIVPLWFAAAFGAMAYWLLDAVIKNGAIIPLRHTIGG